MDDAASPRVTVLMCVYNGAPYLREAIDSILAQTYTDFELLIVDDSSTDGSVLVAESYRDARLRLIRNSTNRGLARALNAGLAATRGEFVARHDADDVSAATRLSRQVEFLERHPCVAAAGTQASFMDAAGRQKYGLPHRKATTPVEMRWQIMFGSPLFHGSVMFRTHVVRDVFGGYDETVRVGEDFELWSRLMLAGEQLLNLPEVLLSYRVHADSLSAQYQERDRDRVLQIMAANIAAYAPIGEVADEWKRIAGAIGFGAPAGLADIRRLAAILTMIRGAFVARLAPSDPAEVDAYMAGILTRAAAQLYRRCAPAAFYAFAYAVKLSPALVYRLGRAVVSAAIELSWWSISAGARRLLGRQPRGAWRDDWS